MSSDFLLGPASFHTDQPESKSLRTFLHFSTAPLWYTAFPEGDSSCVIKPCNLPALNVSGSAWLIGQQGKTGDISFSCQKYMYSVCFTFSSGWKLKMTCVPHREMCQKSTKRCPTDCLALKAKCALKDLLSSCLSFISSYKICLSSTFLSLTCLSSTFLP